MTALRFRPSAANRYANSGCPRVIVDRCKTANGNSTVDSLVYWLACGPTVVSTVVLIMIDQQAAILALLQQLQTQLKETPSLDPSIANQVQAIVREIEATFPRAEQQSPDEPPLADRLRQAALDFEASHPTLSRTVGSIADTLAQIGI